MSSLYAVLWNANVLSHNQRHERRLESERIRKSRPESKIKSSENTWNVAVIDNIDFVEKTFAYGNIFDVGRRSIHATVRMIFQFELPKPVQQILAEARTNVNVNARDKKVSLFGESAYTNSLLNKCEQI